MKIWENICKYMTVCHQVYHPGAERTPTTGHVTADSLRLPLSLSVPLPASGAVSLLSNGTIDAGRSCRPGSRL